MRVHPERLGEQADFIAEGDLQRVERVAGVLEHLGDADRRGQEVARQVAEHFLQHGRGAIVFGRIGDLIGRKYTFLVTIVVMGLATFSVGLLPTFEAIGWTAPIIMVTGHTEKARVTAARDAGITEFLAKPISAKGLYQRILNVVANPRPFIKTKTYFGPDRRRNVNANYVGPERRKGGKADVIRQQSLMDKAKALA